MVAKLPPEPVGLSGRHSCYSSVDRKKQLKLVSSNFLVAGEKNGDCGSRILSCWIAIQFLKPLPSGIKLSEDPNAVWFGVSPRIREPQETIQLAFNRRWKTCRAIDKR